MIGLTDEEIRNLWVAQYTEKWDKTTAEELVGKITFEFSKVVRQAMLKKVVEWGNGYCYDHKITNILKHECILCWQSLLEEVGS